MRSSRGDVALHEAVASGRKELVLWLLRHHQQQQKQTLMEQASIIGRADMQQMASVNAVTAAAASSSSVVAAVQNNGANVANNDGRTPLHVAAVNNNIEMCKVHRHFSFFNRFI